MVHRVEVGLHGVVVLEIAVRGILGVIVAEAEPVGNAEALVVEVYLEGGAPGGTVRTLHNTAVVVIVDFGTPAELVGSTFH